MSDIYSPTTLAKNLLIPSADLEKFSPSIPPLPPSSQKKFIFSCSHCSCTIFVLTSYSLYIQVMLILLLINVQYLQNVVFSFKKCKNGQIHYSSDSQYPIKKNSKIFYPFYWEGPSPSLNAIWKTLHAVSKVKIMKKN